MKQGPNVRRLIVERMSYLMVPPGGELADALGAMIRLGGIEDFARRATEEIEACIASVRSAPDNPYRDDEEIAAAILKGIEEKRARAAR